MPSPTIVDIARLAGVSFKTVSRVINSEPGVSKETRKNVESVIAELNYRPNAWARSLRSTHSYTIALLTSYMGAMVNVNYAQQILAGALDACTGAGYHLMIEHIRESQGLRRQINAIINARQIDGIILLPPQSDNETMVESLITANIPFVRISPYNRLDVGSYVQVNDCQAAYEMTKHLLSLGHRDIALVKGPPSHGSSEERHRGFMMALEDCGGRIRKEWIVPGQYTIRSGMIAGEALLTKESRPTAILAANDDTAIGVMSAAYRCGLSLPQDLSVAGIDGNPIAEAFWPPMTTMSQPIYKIGRAATDILINALKSPGRDERKVFPFKMILRDSVQALPSAQKDGKISRRKTREN